jgi:hypothetical protein
MRRVTWLEPRTPHQPGKLQKLSKNEFVFTPFIFRVNKKAALLSAEKSIECSPSTGHCREFGANLQTKTTMSLTFNPDVPPYPQPLPRALAIHDCENLVKNLAGGRI